MGIDLVNMHVPLVANSQPSHVRRSDDVAVEVPVELCVDVTVDVAVLVAVVVGLSHLSK